MPDKKSFTLIELIVVVIIVGILSAVLVPMIQAAIWRARYSEVYTVVDMIARAKKAYYSRYGTYAGNPQYSAATTPAQCDAGYGIAAGSTRIQQDLGIEIAGNSFFRYRVYPSSSYPTTTFIYFRRLPYDWAYYYNYVTKTWSKYGTGGGPAQQYFVRPK